jgi:hypothetical protein
MSELIAVPKIAQWQKLKMLVPDSVSSPITKRVHDMALDGVLQLVPAGASAGFLVKVRMMSWRCSASALAIVACAAVRRAWSPVIPFAATRMPNESPLRRSFSSKNTTSSLLTGTDQFLHSTRRTVGRNHIP